MDVLNAVQIAFSIMAYLGFACLGVLAVEAGLRAYHWLTKPVRD